MKKRWVKKINVYDYIAEKITVHFKKKSDFSDRDLEKLYLGVVVILLNTFKMLLVCTVAFFIGIFKETVILLSMFTVIRINAAGIHLKSNIGCTAACLVLYLGSTFIAVKHPIDIRKAFIICIFLIIVLYKYSPADTERRPILGEEHRKKLKRRTVKVSIILLILNVFFMKQIIINLLMYAFLIQTICVIPFTYKIFKVNYNNYKQYEG